MFKRKHITTINNQPAELVVTPHFEVEGFNSGTFEVVGALSFKGDYIEHISNYKLYVNVDTGDDKELNLELDTSDCKDLDAVIAKFKLEHQLKIVGALRC